LNEEHCPHARGVHEAVGMGYRQVAGTGRVELNSGIAQFPNPCWSDSPRTNHCTMLVGAEWARWGVSWCYCRSAWRRFCCSGCTAARCTRSTCLSWRWRRLIPTWGREPCALRRHCDPPPPPRCCLHPCCAPALCPHQRGLRVLVEDGCALLRTHPSSLRCNAHTACSQRADVCNPSLDCRHLESRSNATARSVLEWSAGWASPSLAACGFRSDP
jgi:hypothetical protein